MIEFLLMITEVKNKQTGRQLFKRQEWFVVPCKGEMWGIAGNSHEVHNVWHDPDIVPASIKVDIEMDSDDFEDLIGKPGWHSDARAALADKL